MKLAIVRELTGQRRNRVFAYDRYLAILNEGTELMKTYKLCDVRRSQFIS